ncbi:MAG: c-type cytochrome, partial [Alphaproteobacteria bacterium]|nr:c-type cytochrome [Alphaproteobacteria bacterium]
MAAIAKRLNNKEISAVAAYYAAYPKVPEARASSVTQSFDGFTPPPDSAIPNDQFGEMVKLGLNIFRNTQHYAKAYVGNSLNCENCHLDAGRMANSAPLWAAYVSYPAYRSKNKHVNTYAERMQGCFRYSMNGKVPRLGSKTLVALETYSYFLATGAPVGDTKMKGRGYPALPKPAEPFNYVRGEKIYETHCALCHGADGNGQMSANGKPTFPPLWGPHSFNWGAGMGNIKNAAGFIKANMPFSQGMTLSDQDAWDVAMFVDSHERPQDPRFTGNVAETRDKYHDGATWMYGRTVNGVLLGAHSPPSG